MIARDRSPLLSLWLWCANVSHVLLDAALTSMNAELKSITANALGTPKSILRRHLASSMRWFPWLPWTYEREPLTCASNTSERLHDATASLVVFLDDDKDLFPCSNHPGSQHKEDAICFRADWSFHLTLENDERHA